MVIGDYEIVKITDKQIKNFHILKRQFPLLKLVRKK